MKPLHALAFSLLLMLGMVAGFTKPADSDEPPHITEVCHRGTVWYVVETDKGVSMWPGLTYKDSGIMPLKAITCAP